MLGRRKMKKGCASCVDGADHNGGGRLALVLTVLRRPQRIERHVEDALQCRTCLGLLALGHQHFGEEEQADCALIVVGERGAQVVDGAGVATAKESRYPEVPAAECTVRRSVLKRGVDPQYGLQRVLDRSTILDALTQAERLAGELA